jgi:hypothetical protein
MLRVRLVARDEAKVCAGGVSSMWEWHSVENVRAPVTLHAVHPAG